MAFLWMGNGHNSSAVEGALRGITTRSIHRHPTAIRISSPCQKSTNRLVAHLQTDSLGLQKASTACDISFESE